MTETVLGEVIAKGLVFANAILNQLVSGVTYTEGNILNCAPATFSGGTLTACGTVLVHAVPLHRILEGLAHLSQLAIALTV